MIQKIPFGKTGHMSTRTIFGAAALGSVTQAEADRTLDLLLEYGVNHIDTAASYGDAELRIGPWMAQHRGDFFLATKTGERSYARAKEEIHRSLERMRVDSVDLLQLHNLGAQDEWEMTMGEDGALKAAVEAQEQGLVRFVGVTGHGTHIAAMHSKSLAAFPFASILLPYNYAMMQNPQYASDFEQVVATCHEHQVAVQTIKAITRGPWGDKTRTDATWYEPLHDQEDIDRAVHWVFTRPNVFLNTVGDIYILPKVLDAASRYEAQTQAEADAAIARVVLEPLFV